MPNEYDFPDDQFDDDTCHTCNGRGTVNPLTPPERLPRDFFCVGTTLCPDCDGSGKDSF
jgi:DnaJ-class molecular chaperone